MRTDLDFFGDRYSADHARTCVYVPSFPRCLDCDVDFTRDVDFLLREARIPLSPCRLSSPRSVQHGCCHFVSSLVSIFGPGPPGAVFSVLPFSLIVFLCFPRSPPSESPPTSAPAGPGCLPSPCGMWLGSGVSTGREREGEMGKRCVWRRGQWGH